MSDPQPIDNIDDVEDLDEKTQSNIKSTTYQIPEKIEESKTKVLDNKSKSTTEDSTHVNLNRTKIDHKHSSPKHLRVRTCEYGHVSYTDHSDDIDDIDYSDDMDLAKAIYIGYREFDDPNNSNKSNDSDNSDNSDKSNEFDDSDNSDNSDNSDKSNEFDDSDDDKEVDAEIDEINLYDAEEDENAEGNIGFLSPGINTHNNTPITNMSESNYENILNNISNNSSTSIPNTRTNRNGFLGYVSPSGTIIPPEEASPSLMHGRGIRTMRENMRDHRIARENRPRHRHRRRSVAHTNITDTTSLLTENDIMDKEINSEFIQPINVNCSVKSINYIDLCDKLMEKIKLLESSSLHIDENVNTEEILSDIKNIQNKFKQIVNIGQCFNKRDLMIGSFCNTAANCVGHHPGTKGDYDRKSLECPRALETLFSDDIYGNPIGSAIYFVFSEITPSEMIIYMDKLKQTTERPECERLKFGDYRLDKIFKEDYISRTENIGEQIKYAMVMTDTNTNISMKCYCVDKLDTADVRVQSLDYCGKKIFDAIPDLVLRRVVHNENLTKYIRNLTGTMPRESRAAIWEHILLVLDKDIKYLNYGYKCIDIGENKMIKVSHEDTEPCVISAINPPYMKIHLACGHAFSLMAIYGIVYEGKSEDTESILCPICRRNLIPKLVPALTDEDLLNFSVKTYKNSDLKNVIDTTSYTFENGQKLLDVIKTNVEQDNYIDNLFEKKEKDDDEEDNDSDNNDHNHHSYITEESFMNYLNNAIINGEISIN
jgi:hypothetical protein